MKIYVWGTGVYARKLMEEFKIDIAGFVDTNKTKSLFCGVEVITPAQLAECFYDCIVVANSYTSEILDICKSLGIDLNKVIFLYNQFTITSCNCNTALMKQIFPSEYIKMMVDKECDWKATHTIIPKSHTFKESSVINKETMCLRSLNDDYVRIKTFEMVVREIYKNRVPGNLAEVGVFKGEFAQFINRAFPDRTLYLFDSFDSFDRDEAIQERACGNCDNEFIDIFKNTSLDVVMRKMKYSENIVIKQGYFPASLNGLEDDFAFVSLDVDFMMSTLEGLRYFYPRLSKGGYIFVHDYNYCDNLNLQGIEQAIDQYEQEIAIKLCKVPLCDQGGTLIITK